MEPSLHDAPPAPAVAAPKANGADPQAHAAAPSLLKLAIRKARLEEAERSEVVAELRGAETARLEMLEEELKPALADLPPDVDMFDVALAAGDRPRLFVDMIGFVEMGHDRRTYRFIQATRYGRVVIAENERMEPIISAIVDYVARRLIEREKALAGDASLEQAARIYAEVHQPPAPAIAEPAPKAETPARRPGVFARLFTFFVELFGSTVLFALLGIGVWQAFQLLSAWWAAHH